MTIYRIQFQAIIEREVEVPDGLDWSEAARWVRDELGHDNLARSAAAKIGSVKCLDFDTPKYLASWRQS